MRRLLGALLLPLSIAPVVIAVPSIRDEYGAFARRFLHREPQPPPDVPERRWCPLPRYRHAVPVLVYHGVNDRRDVYSVSRQAFASQMQMLHAAGFEAIGIEQYVRFIHGDGAGLPERPILITFDDGRLDSYRGADRILARYGLRATMFAITAQVGSSRFYADWRELREMAASGRWDVQLHAGDGHRRIATAPGRSGPFYANRRFGGGVLESFDAWRRRVIADIDAGRRALERQIPGYEPLAFAYPYGSYGQDGTNDPRIPAVLGALARSRFRAVFVVHPPAYTSPATPAGSIGRYELHTDTTARELHDRLRDRLPAGAPLTRTPACGLPRLQPANRAIK